MKEKLTSEYNERTPYRLRDRMSAAAAGGFFLLLGVAGKVLMRGKGGQGGPDNSEVESEFHLPKESDIDPKHKKSFFGFRRKPKENPYSHYDDDDQIGPIC